MNTDYMKPQLDHKKTAFRLAFERALLKVPNARTPVTGKVYRALHTNTGIHR